MVLLTRIGHLGMLLFMGYSALLCAVCEEWTLHQPLEIYKEPSLFLDNPDESLRVGTFVGKLEVEKIEKDPTPFHNLFSDPRIWPMSREDNKYLDADPLIYFVRFCKGPYEGLRGVVIDEDLKRAEKRLPFKGTGEHLPPSVEPNDIPELPPALKVETERPLG